jgi:hypothetical protein
MTSHTAPTQSLAQLQIVLRIVVVVDSSSSQTSLRKSR